VCEKNYGMWMMMFFKVQCPNFFRMIKEVFSSNPLLNSVLAASYVAANAMQFKAQSHATSLIKINVSDFFLYLPLLQLKCPTCDQ